LGGCRFIKLRVGATRFADDLARVDAAWQVIRQKNMADSVTLSVDANQAWNIRNALDRITALAKYGVTIVEQPVHFDSVDRLLELKRRCPIKLFGDEGAAGLADITKLIELGAVDGVHIKLIKCGGITNAVRIMHLAEAHGIDYMVGGMDEGMLAVAAAVHCAAVADTDLFELHGHMRIAQDPSTGLCSQGSFVEVPRGPGFGITVDTAKLKKVFET
jgi:L-alanine-DL-glutamate epimerase-like enolase superfamily enzyme